VPILSTESKKIRIFPVIKHETLAIHESQKVELEILIGQGSVFKYFDDLFPSKYTTKWQKESSSENKKPNYSSSFFPKPPPHP